LSTIINNHY